LLIGQHYELSPDQLKTVLRNATINFEWNNDYKPDERELSLIESQILDNENIYMQQDVFSIVNSFLKLDYEASRLIAQLDKQRRLSTVGKD
jgi:hypothetical protein